MSHSLFSFSCMVISSCIASSTFAQQYNHVHLDVLGYSKFHQHVYIQESPIHSNSKMRVYAYDLKKVRYDFPKHEETTAQAQNAIEFEQRLNTLKKDLHALKEIDINSLKIYILQQDKNERVQSEIPFNFSYSTQFIISNAQFQTHVQNLYHLSPDIQLTHAYILPEHKGILATFKSLAYAEGSGLYREESVILLPKQVN